MKCELYFALTKVSLLTFKWNVSSNPQICIFNVKSTEKCFELCKWDANASWIIRMVSGWWETVSRLIQFHCGRINRIQTGFALNDVAPLEATASLGPSSHFFDSFFYVEWLFRKGLIRKHWVFFKRKKISFTNSFNGIVLTPNIAVMSSDLRNKAVKHFFNFCKHLQHVSNPYKRHWNRSR